MPHHAGGAMGVFSRLIMEAREEVELERKDIKKETKAISDTDLRSSHGSESKHTDNDSGTYKETGESKSSGEDYDVIEKTLQFFEFYFLRDDELLQQIFDFEETHCAEFDIPVDESEHQLHHFELHREFLALFEKSVEKYLEREGHTITSFYDLVNEKMQESAPSKREGARALLELFQKSSDYALWAANMRQTAIMRRELEEVD